MSTNLPITEQVTLAGLRRQAQRLGITDFPPMKKRQLQQYVLRLGQAFIAKTFSTSAFCLLPSAFCLLPSALRVALYLPRLTTARN
ncbi:MAG: hypothetical protein F6K16_42825 [Symploca sp. SIO2B6]|nr:hypothetical protein [Symploca sp. SIO2B6]